MALTARSEFGPDLPLAKPQGMDSVYTMLFVSPAALHLGAELCTPAENPLSEILEMTLRKPTILVADDSDEMREVLELRLQEWGFEVLLATDGEEAAQLADTQDPDLVLADLVMPRLSGLELLRRLKTEKKHRPVILITAEGTIDTAVEAMKQGAHDFVKKPLDYPMLRSVLDSARQEVELRQVSEKLNSQLERKSGFGDFVGTCKAMRELYELIRKVGANDTSVIITGASGTGKELVARIIHQLSRRSRGPFIAINAAAIPEQLIESEVFGHEKGAYTGAVGARAGCFERAHKGTLLLDEIAEMPMSLQPKLLRVLEERCVSRLGGNQEIPVDVRVLAATNIDPRMAVQSGKLREDLYYRLNVFTISVPPLAGRSSDIPLLTQHFIREFNRKHGLSVEGVREETAEILRRYTWPGNVRELRNVIERAVILAMSGWIEPSHLPSYVTVPDNQPDPRIVLPADISLAEAEREILVRTLKDARHNKAEAARRLGVDVKTIRHKMKAYGIDEE
jgi:DNA-binding NtrC family response regulator